jgi:hypothetical protein
MSQYLCASKEINGQIYITRLSQAIDDHTPGIPSETDDGVWYFVGPGSRPSIQQYNPPNQFILTFDFLSHLTCRIVDISTWPPTVVNPIGNASSGGPNTSNQWQPTTFYPTGSQIVDPAHHLQQAGGTGAPGGNGGVSGSIMPTWNDSGGTTTDGTGNTQIVWVDRGHVASFTTQFSFMADAITLNLKGGNTDGSVNDYFNPPLIDRGLLFIDATTNTYSVTISLDPSWVPFLLNPNYTAYFRLYRRAIGTLPWILLQDWVPTTFSYTDSALATSPFRYQYTATWGDLYSPSAPFNPVLHAEGIPGFYVVTVDSTVEHPSYQFQVNEPLTLKFESDMAFVNLDPRQEFVVESPSDTIGFPVSTIGRFGDHPIGTMAYGTVESRQEFIAEAVSEVPINIPFGAGPSNYYGSMSATAQLE